ncbi:MAG: hypothetical protein ACRD22_20140, partial [Terriglobia bacterium]
MSIPIPRLSLQSKIIIIFIAAVVCLLAVSTFIAMFLTREPIEEEVYRKELTQARLAAHNLTNDRDLLDQKSLMRSLRQMQHDLPGIREADVYLHTGNHPLIATTNPAGKHMELDHIPG